MQRADATSLDHSGQGHSKPGHSRRKRSTQSGIETSGLSDCEYAVPMMPDDVPDGATADIATCEPGFPGCCDAPLVRRGRPSIAEAEALSGRILAASWDVLLAGGLESFTFDRVARHAHIGKATIYSRFPGKAELLRALVANRIALRSDHLKQRGSDLPLEQAFCLRAADTIKMLFSPDHVLLERLIDWLEQETGEGHRMRVAAFRDAIESVGLSLAEGGELGERTDQGRLPVVDPDRAGRLWIEALMGHAKLAYTEGASSPAEIERWAANYTRFFFAGLRAMVGND